MMTSAQAALDPPLCERSVELQAVILELTSADDHCGDFPENVLREATKLDAKKKGIVSLKRGDFKDFDNLNTLLLNENRLRRLPGNVFDGLGNLNKEINLQDNQLSIVSRNAFNGLRKLKRLNLWNNKLTTLEGGMFRYLGELTYLNIGHNDLSSFSTDAFDNLAKLEELHLHWNELQTLPHKSWLRHLGLPDGRLQVLNLGYNQLRELNGDAFEEVKLHLRQLRLNNNQLRWLPEGIFHDMNLNPTRGPFVIRGKTLIENLVDGALRLDGNPGDGEPFGSNPDSRSGDSNETTTNEDVFTLPYYVMGTLRSLRQNNTDNYQLDEPAVYTPHRAPFTVGLSWFERSGIRTTNEIFEDRLYRIRAGKRDSESATAEIHWRQNEDMSIDFDVNPPDFSTSDCGFSPCYDGFGFHSYGVAQSRGLELRCVVLPRLHSVSTEADRSGHACGSSNGRTQTDLHPTFVSSPADKSKGYRAGEDVEVQVTFERGPLAQFDPVRVRLRIGDEIREAGWVPTQAVGFPEVGSGSNKRQALRFRYRITEEDADSNGIEIVSMSGDGDIDSPYREAGTFHHGKTFNRPANSDHKVYGGRYVSFTSDTVSGKEGEKVYLNLRVAPAPASDLVVNYHASRTRGVSWNDYDTEGSGEDGGSLTIRSGETEGRIGIRIVDGVRHSHDNREPEQASQHFYMDIRGGEGYERGVRRRMTVIIKEGVCNRTPGVQEALMAATGRRDCGDVTSEDLKAIGELDLRNRGIRRLKRSDFLELDQVTVLDLRDNRLSALPEGVFGEISDTLKVLRLQGNRWQEDLPARMFTGLPNAQAIFVSDDSSSDAPIQLPLRIEYAGERPDFPLAAGTRVELKAVLREGAPYAFSARFQSTGTNTGYQLDTERSFARGDVESDTFTWTAAEKTNQIVISVTDLSAPPEDCPVKDGEGRCFSGVNIVSAEQVTLGGVRLRVRVFLENALE